MGAPLQDRPLPPQSALMSVDVLALIADAVICTDEDGRIILFNRAAEQSFGYSTPEVIGQHVEMLLPKRHRAEHAHQVRSFASGGGAANRLMGHQREVWGRRKNGEEFPSEATVSRHSVDGRTILTAVHRDITERKELEKRQSHSATGVNLSTSIEDSIGLGIITFIAAIFLNPRGAFQMPAAAP